MTNLVAEIELLESLNIDSNRRLRVLLSNNRRIEVNSLRDFIKHTRSEFEPLSENIEICYLLAKLWTIAAFTIYDEQHLMTNNFIEHRKKLAQSNLILLSDDETENQTFFSIENIESHTQPSTSILSEEQLLAIRSRLNHSLNSPSNTENRLRLENTSILSSFTRIAIELFSYKCLYQLVVFLAEQEEIALSSPIPSLWPDSCLFSFGLVALSWFHPVIFRIVEEDDDYNSELSSREIVLLLSMIMCLLTALVCSAEMAVFATTVVIYKGQPPHHFLPCGSILPIQTRIFLMLTYLLSPLLMMENSVISKIKNVPSHLLQLCKNNTLLHHYESTVLNGNPTPTPQNV